jgi:hypothetical protein
MVKLTVAQKARVSVALTPSDLNQFIKFSCPHAVKNQYYAVLYRPAPAVLSLNRFKSGVFPRTPKLLMLKQRLYKQIITQILRKKPPGAQKIALHHVYSAGMAVINQFCTAIRKFLAKKMHKRSR